MRALIAAAILAFGAATAFAQPPPATGQRGAGPPAPAPEPLVPTGLIVGRVIDPVTERGVPGALVTISGGVRTISIPPQPGAPRPAPPAPPPRYLTDNDGRFAFRNLTRGSYVLTVSKPGYAAGAHGRLRPNGPTRPIVLGDGERVGEVLIRLFKLGAIEGTVIDEAGEPIVGVSLRAYRRLLMGGRRVFAPFGGNVVTDDRGMYRLAQLTPGDYVVSVPMVSTSLPNGFTPDPRSSPNFQSTISQPNTTGLSFGGPRQVTPDGRFLLQTGSPNSTTAGAIVEADGGLRTSPTTFYPSARSIGDAQIVSIASGEERAGVDVVLPLVAASNVSGQLVSPEGPANGYALHLVPAETGLVAVEQPVASAVTAGDGSFMFLAVPPGQYVLQTTRVPRGAPPPPPPPPPPGGGGGEGGFFAVAPATAASGPMLWASMPVAVGETDLAGLVVMLQEGLTVSGRIEFDGTAARPAPARLAQVPLILEPTDALRGGTPPARPQPDGRFTTNGVRPGQYLLRVGGAPPGWTFRAAMLDGVDISDVPVSIDADLTGVVVVFTDRPAELRGSVAVPSGVPTDAAALIFPADNAAWKNFGTNSRRFRMARPNAAGALMFGSLPPGEYFAVAVPEEYGAEWQDPAYLEQLAPIALRFTLLDGEQKTVEFPFRDVRPPGVGAPAAAIPPPDRLTLPEPAGGGVRDVSTSGPFVPDDAAPPQARDRATDAARAGTASISGVVVLGATNTPVRRARVSVLSPEVRAQLTAMTDDAGRFAFTSLPPGRYTLSVAKPAFLTAYHGSRQIGRGPGTPIEVAAGQQVTGLTLPIHRGGVVSGVVVDAYGQPFPSARIRLFRYATRNGERTLQGASSSGPGMTDDRGAYRLYGILPGSYVVSVTAPMNTGIETRLLSAEEMNAAHRELQQAQARTVSETGTQLPAPTRTIAPAPAGSTTERPRDGRALGYSPVFYPGTPLEHEAVTVTVAASEELSGIDIPLRLVPTARVEGRLLMPDGQPAARASMQLASTVAGSTTTRSVRLMPDGRFQVLGVAPGRYTLTARLNAAPPMPPRPPAPPGAGVVPAPVMLANPDGARLNHWAMQELDVNGEDITDLALTLAEAMTVSGRVVFDGQTAAPAPEAVRIALEAMSATRLQSSARPVTIDASGNFTITGVTPGRYRLQASVSGGAAPAADPRWTLRSVVIAGREATDLPFEIAGGEHVSGAVVTLTDRVTALSGTILDASNEPVPGLTVLVFPADRTFWTMSSRRLRAPIRAADGRYRLTALPPGEYYLAVVTDIDPADWGDPAYFEQLAAAAIRIAIGEGEQKVQDIRIGGG